MKEIVIIGAGIAGLACGDRLRKQGITPQILEKSPGVGGRVSTRRAQDTWLDHGLAYLQTGTDERYNAWLKELLEQGVIQFWTENRFFLSVHGLANQLEDRPLFASAQGLNSVGKYLAQKQQISLNTKVIEIKIKDDRWQIVTDKEEFRADILVMTPPAPQTKALLMASLSDHPEIIRPLDIIEFNSIMVLLAGYYSYRSVPSDWEVIECKDNQVLHSLYFNSTKHSNPSCASLVLHSTVGFAQEYLEAKDLAPIGEKMLEELGHLLIPQLAKPDWWQVHRWRYGRVCQSLEMDSLASYRPLPLFFAGDWLAGGGIENAFLSGVNTAEEIISSFFVLPSI